MTLKTTLTILILLLRSTAESLRADPLLLCGADEVFIIERVWN